MPNTPTRTWTQAEIERAIKAAFLSTGCPRCLSLFSHAAREVHKIGVGPNGPWTLSVGVRDVTVTIPATCAIGGHQFTLSVSLWRKARTPYGAMKIKKATLAVPGAPRPLRFM
jgi:hypothetical protein